MLMLVMSVPASASFLYGPNGKDRVHRGDSAAEVLSIIGRPAVRTLDTVCVKKRSGYCKKYENVETWQYYIDDIDWRVKFVDGEVTEVSRHR